MVSTLMAPSTRGSSPEVESSVSAGRVPSDHEPDLTAYRNYGV